MSDDPESELVAALREKASAKKDESQFAVAHGDVVIQVSYSGGSSSSLTLFAAYDTFAKGRHDDAREGGSYRQTAVPRTLRTTRPMLITLRPEQYADREAKQAGLNREHQTGDEAFDRAVYIDSPTTDHEVLQAVLCEQARAAVLDLFGLGLRRITIDDSRMRVEAYLNEFSVARSRPGRADAMLEAFAQLCTAMPKVEDSGGVHAPAPFGCLSFVGGAFAGVLGIAAIPLFFAIASTFDCTESDGEGTSLKSGCGVAPLLGLLAGALAGGVAVVVARLFLGPRLRGRSDSASRLGTLTFIAFALAAEVTFLVVATTAYARKW